MVSQGTWGAFVPRGSALRLGCPCKTQPLGGGSIQEERQGHAPHEVIAAPRAELRACWQPYAPRPVRLPAFLEGDKVLTCPVAWQIGAKGHQPPSRQRLDGGV